jgi:hypothetical protein
MAHVQQQILDAVKAVLIAAATDAGENVFIDHLDPLALTQLPALLIEEAPSGESVAPSTVSGVERRDLRVSITPVVAHATEYGARARELGLQVEVALAAATPQLLKLAKAGFAIESGRMLLSGEGKEAKAARQQIWRFSYLVRPGAPGVAL